MTGLRLLMIYLGEFYFITTPVVQHRESREHLSVIQIELGSNFTQIILLQRKASFSMFGTDKKVSLTRQSILGSDSMMTE